MGDELCIGNDFEKMLWSGGGTVLGICLERLRKTTEILRKYRWFPSCYWNRAPPKELEEIPLGQPVRSSLLSKLKSITMFTIIPHCIVSLGRVHDLTPYFFEILINIWRLMNETLFSVLTSVIISGRFCLNLHLRQLPRPAFN
jgi:hypothetical protein